MTWDQTRADEVVRSYRLLHELSRGSDADRRRADAEHWWAWEAVGEAVEDGDLPLEVLDAMLHDPAADAEHRAYIAAGPIEDLLSDFPDEYAAGIAERCRTDRLWSDTVAHVWLEHDDWLDLPADLQRRIPEPPTKAGRSSAGGPPASRPRNRSRRR